MNMVVCFLLNLAMLLSLTSLFATSSQPHILPIARFALWNGIILEGGYIGWFIVKKAYKLPRTGLEALILFFLASILLSFVLSPQPLNGIDRIAWFVTYFVWVYLLLDCQQYKRFPLAIRNGMLVLSGILLLEVVLETYLWYQNWWELTGSITTMPPYTYRFKGFFGSNTFMAFINLCAPVAFVGFLKAKNFASRIVLATWLVLYAIAIPFSSSRGGWLGAFTWVSILVFLWILEDLTLEMRR